MFEWFNKDWIISIVQYLLNHLRY